MLCKIMYELSRASINHQSKLIYLLNILMIKIT